MKDLIANDFCPSAGRRDSLQQAPFSISRTYNDGTPNQVTLTMDLESGLNAEGGREDCVKHLMMAVDDCDTSADVNPANYKGGGFATIGKDTYRVSLGSPRAAAGSGTNKYDDCLLFKNTTFPSACVVVALFSILVPV